MKENSFGLTPNELGYYENRHAKAADILFSAIYKTG